MSFADELLAAQMRIENALERTRVLLIQRLYRDIIFDTPVLDGTLRGSWRTSTDRPSEDQSPVTDPAGVGTTRAMEVVVNGSTWGVDVCLVNNIPYAYRIEFLGWSAVKAPQGMVRRNVLRVQDILQSVQRQVNRR
ncbi:hypothetical protein LVQ77_17005 [Buttiauxella sp. S04-F03]|uniref:hypothetical protein n=1 Tax=Buttiauxella sp. W03-F01 TaxID=2904524 RepID=UPI001E42FA63|nr:hypothetical protein [Buttiauxella sp. W03-F01]MCE0801985.1 hypothetical protein [Buttiauxella sp. W03-F01]